MAKRFIDTGMFEDPWFSELSKDGKVAWVFMITRCNHAGLFECPRKLMAFQTGIENIDDVFDEMDKKIQKIGVDKWFIPSFIKFQYPDFPKSGVKAQDSAMRILIQNKIKLDWVDITTPEMKVQYQPKPKGRVSEKIKRGLS